MNNNNSLQQQFQRCMPYFVALGDSVRLKIISALNLASSTGLNVLDITKQTDLSRPAVSHHLKILKEAGMVNLYKKGTANYYYLTIKESTEHLMDLGYLLQNTIEDNPIMDFTSDNE